MVEWMVSRIKEKRNISVEEGKKMYKTYFRVSLYRRLYKDQVDEILRIDGCDDVILPLEELTA